MEALLKQILTGINEINTRLDSLENGQKVLTAGQNGLIDEVKEISRKTSVILEQTAHLTEFETTVKSALNEIKKDVSFDSLNRIEDKIDTIHQELNTIEKVTIKNSADIIDLQAYRKENWL